MIFRKGISLFILTCIAGLLSAQQNIETNILNRSSVSPELKKSMIEHGWIYRDSFPHFVKYVKSGRAPKSCTFSPDGKNIYVTLLNQKKNGVDIFDFTTMIKIKTITPGCTDPEKNIGYPEGTFNHFDKSFWFTRMTTGEFFVYKNGEIENYSSKGIWPKVIEFDPDYNKIAISNWLSNTVTIFYEKTRKHFITIKTGKTPRGIAWINWNTFAVALFGEGKIQVFQINNDKPIFTIEYNGRAARDIIYDKANKILYFSDMGRNRVYKYDWENKKMISTLVVDQKPNTIKLTPDKRYLLVSCRGPNNPENYVLKSPRNGKLFLIQTSDFSIVHSWWGGNQPTGLDISPDGKYISTTDFQESRLNLYRIAL